MKRFLLFLVPVLLLVLQSCETAIEVPLPPHQSRLVVNSAIQPGKPVDLYLSKSFGLDDNLPYEELLVQGAEVKIFESGSEVATLTYVDTVMDFWNGQSPTGQGGELLGKYTLNSFLPQAGKVYDLKVSHPDFEPVSSSAQVVEPVSMTQVGLRKDEFEVTDFDGFTSYQSLVDVTFTDQAGTGNYYAFSLEISYRDTVFSPGEVFRQRVGVEGPVDRKGANGYEADDRWATDETGDGQEMNLEVLCYLPGYYNNTQGHVTLDFDTLFVTMYSVDENYYRYLQKLEDQYTQNDGFALFPSEPIVVYTNIEGGYGFWGSQHIAKDTLTF